MMKKKDIQEMLKEHELRLEELKVKTKEIVRNHNLSFEEKKILFEEDDEEFSQCEYAIKLLKKILEC